MIQEFGKEALESEKRKVPRGSICRLSSEELVELLVVILGLEAHKARAARYLLLMFTPCVRTANLGDDGVHATAVSSVTKEQGFSFGALLSGASSGGSSESIIPQPNFTTALVPWSGKGVVASVGSSGLVVMQGGRHKFSGHEAVHLNADEMRSVLGRVPDHNERPSILQAR